MAPDTRDRDGRRGSRKRIATWAGAITFILLIPLLAMQVTDEVAWDIADFIFVGVLLTGTGVTYEVAARTRRTTAYRAAVGIALAATVVLIWMNAAVGVIGSEGDAANLMFGGVLAVGTVGALVARFRPDGMARAMCAMALAQVLIAAVALAAGLGSASANWPLDVLFLSGFFAALWLMSAWLFGRAARQQPPRGSSADG